MTQNKAGAHSAFCSWYIGFTGSLRSSGALFELQHINTFCIYTSKSREKQKGLLGQRKDKGNKRSKWNLGKSEVVSK